MKVLVKRWESWTESFIVFVDQVGQVRYIESMKTLQLAKAKAHFSSVIKDVVAGDEVAITYGKQKETIAVIIPYKNWKRNQPRKLGTLEGKATVTFAEDFYMTDEELINS